ncbi:hypothetical protein ACT3QR_10880 [Psychrobacter sp. AOP7-B1-25]|uniref:hypothetical protein n=1 Tax=Psychrobacter sp. AOP7-B1-25 TaxID=3457644 RepID=UPI00402B80BD
MTQPNSEQQPPHNSSSDLSKRLPPILKAVFSFLLPYLLSPPNISIHIYHINILF